MVSNPTFFILTGAPGSGKTTLLTALSPHVRTVPEAARRVLATARATGSSATGDQNPAAFVQRMLVRAIEDYDSASGPTVFDRGLPDLLAYCAHYNLADEVVRHAIAAHRYCPTVFVLPAWREIYSTDAERTLDYDGAAAFGEQTRNAYLQSEYNIIDVPKTSCDARVQFILEHLPL